MNLFHHFLRPENHERPPWYHLSTDGRDEKPYCLKVSYKQDGLASRPLLTQFFFPKKETFAPTSLHHFTRCFILAFWVSDLFPINSVSLCLRASTHTSHSAVRGGYHSFATGHKTNVNVWRTAHEPLLRGSNQKKRRKKEKKWPPFCLAAGDGNKSCSFKHQRPLKHTVPSLASPPLLDFIYCSGVPDRRGQYRKNMNEYV